MRDDRVMERRPALTEREIDELKAQFPDIEWEVRVTPPVATLGLAFSGDGAAAAYQKRLNAKILGALLLPATTVMTIGALVDRTFGWTLLAALFAVALSAAVVQSHRQTKCLKRRRAIGELIATRVALVSDHISDAWATASESDDDTRTLLVDWMLAKGEISRLEARITEGVQARKKLSPVDPMRETLQVEIDALRVRRGAMQAARQQQGRLISSAVRRHLDEKQRQNDEELRRVADEERQRKYEERLHSIGDEEQARLKAQERAHDWLHENE